MTGGQREGQGEGQGEGRGRPAFDLDVPSPSARALLDSLRRVESGLEAERRFVRLAEAELGAASLKAASPATSPEEAEHTARYSRELRDTLAADLGRARERAARLERERRDVLAGMDRSGFFGDRWVGDGAGAVYLRVDPGAREEDRRRLLRAPWPVVKDAPPGDHPEETIRRGEILAATARRRRELLALAATLATSFYLSDLFLPAPWSGAVLLVAAVVALAALPAASRCLLERVFLRERALLRAAEARAAEAHLDLVRRGVKHRPPLDKLLREVEEGVRSARRGDPPKRAAKVAGPGGDGEARGGADPGAGGAENAAGQAGRKGSSGPDKEGTSA